MIKSLLKDILEVLPQNGLILLLLVRYRYYKQYVDHEGYFKKSKHNNSYAYNNNYAKNVHQPPTYSVAFPAVFGSNVSQVQ